MKKNFLNSLIYFVFFLIFLKGNYFVYFSGIAIDMHLEEIVFLETFNALNKFFLNNDFGGIKNLLFSFGDQVYTVGIGLYLISLPFKIILSEILKFFIDITPYGLSLISKNFFIFNLFFISSFFFYKIFFCITDNKYSSIIATISYLCFPYFIGHSLINPKDIPFGVFWIICTSVSFDLSKNFYVKNHAPPYQIFLLAFLTSFLISIRIAGLLILVQYLILLTLILEKKKISFFNFIKNEIKNIFIFFIILIFCILFFYPVVFIDLKSFFYKSIISSVKFQQNTCTYIFGNCIKAHSIPINYIFIFFLLKMPLIVILGNILIPVTEKKIPVAGLNKLFFFSLFINSIFILLIFILAKVSIYNEIRHIIFLSILFFILGYASLFFLNKKFFYIVSIISIFFFTIENFITKNSHYASFNLISRILNLQKNFEIDYWGTSNRNLYSYVKKNFNNYQFCIYGDQNVYDFLYNFQCKELISKATQAKKPFLIVQTQKNIYRDFKNCEIIYEEKKFLLFYNENLITGRILYCK